MKSHARFALPAMSLLVACAAHPLPRATAPQASRTAVRGGEFHITARPGGGGDGYDAAMLMFRGSDMLRANHFEEAIAVFERLEREFPTSNSVPLSRFNRGVCLQQLERWSDAATALRASASSSADPTLVHDARFRLAAVGERAEQWLIVLEATDAILATAALTRIDRIEANGRRAVAMLATGQRAEALRLAELAIAEAPDAEAINALGDDTWVARSRFVQAETTRLAAAEIDLRAEAPDFSDAITRRVQRTVHAHAQFNAAIRVGNPDWAAAAGFRIGEMYQELHRALADAPTHAPWDEHAREVYRRRTSERLRTLLIGALRSWEATLTMARRNGILNNEWVRRANDAMDDLRRSTLGAS